MTPGTYLRLRRVAAELTLDDVALMLRTVPNPYPAHERAAWLRLLEADAIPITADVVEALAGAFPFDRHVLILLVAIYAGAFLGHPAVCTACGCSQMDPCVAEDGETCGWAAGGSTLCTACDRPGPADGEPALPVPGNDQAAADAQEAAA